MQTVPVIVTHALVGLGQRVALARRARELTQEDLALLASVGRSTVKALEAGHHGVSLGNLLKVLKAMDLVGQADELLAPDRDPAMSEYAQRALRR